MKSGIEKLLVLLAASGFSEKEIYFMLKGVRETSPAAAVEEIGRIRNMLFALSISGKETAAPHTIHVEQNRSHIERIANLLLQEARLAPGEAAARLRGSIAASGGANNLPQFRAKEGFKNWLGKLLGVMSPSELLHHATRVRNTVVHQDSSDWPLRER